MLGGDVDGVHAATAQDRKRAGTRIAHLLGHDPLEELRRRGGNARGDLGQLRIAEQTAEHEVVAGQTRDRGHERARGLVIHQIGEQHDERATPRPPAQELERGAVVRLAGGDLDLPQLLGKTKELATATARHCVAAHGVGEAQQADLVPARDRDVAEHERGVHGVIQLGEAAERARHHPSGVEQDLDALLTLGLVLDGDGTAAACGRGPRDRAWVVVGLVLAQPLEDRARARDARAALARVVREPAA